MRLAIFRSIRRHLCYANVAATLALFFALTGSAVAGVKYLTASDPITAGDLAGSTYGDPMIAAGTVTSGKIADGAITSSKFSSSAVAPNAATVAGQDIVHVSLAVPGLDPYDLVGPYTMTCPSDRVAIQATMVGDPDLEVFATYSHSSANVSVGNNSTTQTESGSVYLTCFGS